MCKSIGIGSCCSTCSRSLKRNFFGFCRFNDQFAQIVMNTWCVENYGTISTFLITFLFLFNHGSCGVVCDISNNRNIRFNSVCTVSYTHLDVYKRQRVKRVVLDSVKKDGWSVLNADDDYSMRLMPELDSKVALFSLDENNPHIKKFAKEGKITCVYEDGFITIKKGDWKIRVAKAHNIPITMEGKAKFMISNVLAASLATYLYGFEIEDISNSLRTFIPSAQLTPGRLNIFKFKNFKVLIDFAHNPAAVSYTHLAVYKRQFNN